MKTRALVAALSTGIAIVALSGCLYRMDIPQGNRIEPELVSQLEIGMSREQVKFLLGSPAIVDPFHPDEWHYVYYHKYGRSGVVEKRTMVLRFRDGQLAAVDGSLTPG